MTWSASESITTQLTPIVCGYFVGGYQERQIIDEFSAPISFQEDLSQLADDTTWIVSYDLATGQYKITVAE